MFVYVENLNRHGEVYATSEPLYDEDIQMAISHALKLLEKNPSSTIQIRNAENDLPDS